MKNWFKLYHSQERAGLAFGEEPITARSLTSNGLRKNLQMQGMQGRSQVRAQMVERTYKWS